MAVSGAKTTTAGRDWEDELDRIAAIYAPWQIGKIVTGPGWLAQCKFWDGSTIWIQAPDLVILEARLRDHREPERRARDVGVSGHRP